MKFELSDFRQFEEWLDFDMEAITWEGKFKEEFYEFWHLFFCDGLTMEDLQSRFHFALKIIRTGTLNAWLNWLSEKFVCYLFVKKNITVLELSELNKTSLAQTGVMLFNFFVAKYPHKRLELSQIFHGADITSPMTQVTFLKLKNTLDLGSFHGKKSIENKGSDIDDIMTSTEVTLYPEWKNLVYSLRREAEGNYINYQDINRKDQIKSVLKFFKEVTLLSTLATLMVLGLKWVNQYYEKNLNEKIGIYEPEFLWLDKNLTYKQQNTDTKKIEADLKALEELTQAIKTQEVEFKPEDRFDTESEVVLTSIDKITNDAEIKPEEPTIYEETDVAGYRDTSVGDRKVYRLLMKSAVPLEVRNELNKLLQEYSVTQVDKVKPGTIIPGGIYYNLHVPKLKLQEFMKKASLISEASLYESKVRNPAPAGKVKVFIWIKSL